MSRVLFTTLFILISYQIRAQDCGNIPNGTTVRLDNQDGPLADSKVQDQDGLGTCYANTASVVLQSTLKDNPDVSYLNLALRYAEKHSANKNNASYAYDANGNLLLNGGHICETIEEAKKYGVCQRKDVPLEASLFHPEAGHFSDVAHVQKQLLEKISRYYDDVNNTFNQNKTNPPSSNQVSSPRNAQQSLNAEKITEVTTTLKEKTSQFFSKVGNSFKSFFNMILDRTDPAPNDIQPDKEAVIVDLSVKENPASDPLGDFIKEKNLSQDKLELTTENITQQNENQITVEDLSKNSASNEANPNEFTKDKFELLKTKKNLTPKEEYQLALYTLLQKNMPSYAKKNCERNDPKNSMNVAKNLAALTYNLMQSDSKKPEFAALKYSLYNSYSTRGTGKTKIVEFNLNDNIKKAVENDYFIFLKSTPNLKSGQDALVKALKNNLPSYITEDNLKMAISLIDSDLLNKLEEDYQRYTLKDHSLCAQDKIAYLKNDDGLMKDFANTPCLSSYKKLGQGIQELAIGLGEQNAADINRINDFILNSPDMNYDKSLMSVLSPTCTEENKITLPKDLTCKNYDIKFPSLSGNSSTITDNKLAEEKNKFRQNISRSLMNQKAIGVSLCTIFFQEDPNYSYNQNKSCNVARSDGLHAVAITGYRCQNGKLDYLIQNSWGEWRDLNEIYERDRDFGKAWIPEEAMVKNSYQYSIIEN